MTILSPSDDFWYRTLAPLSNAVSRLDYVSGLRQPGGTYAHWGLTRTFGEAAANEAIARAHSQVFSEILRTPLKRLVEELRSTAADRGAETQDILGELLSRGDRLIPPRLAGGSKRHFNSIWQALSALERALGQRSGPAA
jgi:hypothetical protein